MEKIIKINDNSIGIFEKITSIEKINNKTFINKLAFECVLREIIDGFLELKKKHNVFFKIIITNYFVRINLSNGDKMTYISLEMNDIKEKIKRYLLKKYKIELKNFNFEYLSKYEKDIHFKENFEKEFEIQKKNCYSFLNKNIALKIFNLNEISNDYTIKIIQKN